MEDFLWEVEAVAGVAFSQIVDSEEFGCLGNAFHADGESELGRSAGGAGGVGSGVVKGASFDPVAVFV